MGEVERLVTFVDLVDEAAGLRHMSARHDALLSDGSRVPLLDDRGWTTSPPRWYGDGHTADAEPTEVSAAEIEEDARTVVGPDGRESAQRRAT